MRKGETLEIHEVKKSKKISKAHHYQLLYYLYYLKNEKGINDAVGIIDYPKIRRRETLKLDERNEKEIKNIIKRIGNILSDKMPAPQKVPACLKCAYYLNFALFKLIYCGMKKLKKTTILCPMEF